MTHPGGTRWPHASSPNRRYRASVPLEYCADTSPAAWIEHADVPWSQLAGFGPGGFEAYVRLRYIPDPERPGQSETDVELPDDHPTDCDQAAAALRDLAAFTSTRHEWYFCLCEGNGFVELPPDIARGPLVEVPHRRYALLRGSAVDADRWAVFVDGGAPPPAFVWPADQAWCFASDVDPHWAGVGASREAVDALKSSALDVVDADPACDAPSYD